VRDAKLAIEQIGKKDKSKAVTHRRITGLKKLKRLKAERSMSLAISRALVR
jgi:hypothetical protein